MTTLYTNSVSYNQQRHNTQSTPLKIDSAILNNTLKYTKDKVIKAVTNPVNNEKLKVKEVYVVGTPQRNMDEWRAVLIDSYTQSGKTKKCFEVLTSKMDPNENTLVLFVTQANSVASANQTLQRAKVNPDFITKIPQNNIFKSSVVPEDGVPEGNYMIVDFWNSKNMDNMLSFVKSVKFFDRIIIVIDEAEQGGIKGVKERLGFIRQVEKAAHNTIVNVIFITATIANLSKTILQVAKDNLLKFRYGVVNDIVNKPVVEHHFATPHETYVGASWFKDTPDVWTRLVFPKREADMDKSAYAAVKNKHVMRAIKALPKESKELSLIVTSTRTCDHTKMAERLYRIGYNVTVELNGTNNKNYRVNYIDDSGNISEWNIPFHQIDSKADRGDLSTYRSNTTKRKVVKSGIDCKEDYTMAHVLQASLFMMTNAEDRIKQNVSQDEFCKLECISNMVCNLDKSQRRPDDYPDNPRVALIAGHLAGRGITIQNPFIDFTCTSLCFTDTKDAIQRGATNTQRFGRACGMLQDTYARPGRKPILIATTGIMQDALANELSLREKAEEIENGTLISLKDLVTKDDWERMVKKTKESMRTKITIKKRDDQGSEVVDGVSISALKSYFKNNKLLVGKMIRYLYENNNKVTLQQFKEGIDYKKSVKQLQDNLDCGRSVNSQYGKMWCVQEQRIWLNEKIRKILDSV